MTIYRIKSSALKARGEKFESIDRKRAEARLAVVLRTDPKAKLLCLRSEGR